MKVNKQVNCYKGKKQEIECILICLSVFLFYSIFDFGTFSPPYFTWCVFMCVHGFHIYVDTQLYSLTRCSFMGYLEEVIREYILFQR